MLENVKHLKDCQKGRFYRKVQHVLKNSTDYNVYEEVLNTKDHGPPQHREHWYAVGMFMPCKNQKMAACTHGMACQWLRQ